jgi:Tol biopolymer transport system component
MRAFVPLILSFVLGCGNEGAVVAFVRTGADASTGGAVVDAAPEDATSEDAGVADAAEGGEADAALGPFSAATPIAAVDQPDANDTDPSVSSDLRELYFISDRSGNQDIWLSQRDTPDAGWGAPTAVTELNTRMPEQSPGISFDGLTLWFTRSTMGQQQPQIWVTTRAAIGDTWSSPTQVAELDDAGTQLSPKVDEDALLMVFDSTRSGSRQVYSTTRPNMQSQWGPAALVPGLPADAVDPFVASRGVALWFVSSPNGDQDLFTATRPSTAAAFGTAAPIAELNTPAAESDPALSPDFRYIVFSSDRSGTMQLYEASR